MVFPTPNKLKTWKYGKEHGNKGSVPTEIGAALLFAELKNKSKKETQASDTLVWATLISSWQLLLILISFAFWLNSPK